MARPLRIEIEQGVYRVTARGNERRPIIRDDQDRERRLGSLERVAAAYLAPRHCGVPSVEIGKALGRRETSSVGGGCRRVEAALESPSFRRRLRAMKAQLHA
jgi:hypothetical protein